MTLIDSWRWFGENDPVSLEYIKMTGVINIVSALHNIDIGEVWDLNSIINHKKNIEDKGFKWSVVESIPVHESIKYGGSDRDIYINNYIESIQNISKAGIKILCYNFMPIVDWTRTNLMYPNNDGSFCLRFDIIDFIVFDLFILKRENAINSYQTSQIQKAQSKFTLMNKDEIQTLSDNILKGLPGSMVSCPNIITFFLIRIHLHHNVFTAKLSLYRSYHFKLIY